MNCNDKLHNEMEDIICPFCNQQINKYEPINEPCCNNQNMNNDNVCTNCYIDFYDNMYKIRKKSVYQRKYHINNILTKMCEKNDISIVNRNKKYLYLTKLIN